MLFYLVVDVHQRVSTLMVSYGETLIQQLVFAIRGSLPLDRIRTEKGGSISTLLYDVTFFAPHSLDIFKRVMQSDIPQSLASLPLQTEFVADLHQFCKNRDEVGFAIRVKDFSRLLRTAANAGKLQNP
jgi:hypothetical protein